MLPRRAALAHQSSQEHLLAKLVVGAGTPSLDEVLERAGGRAGGSLSCRDAVEAVHEDRDRRRGQRSGSRAPGTTCTVEVLR